jgi:hypothetical protein
VAYSPLGRGFLTGAVAKPDDLGEGDWRRTQPRFAAEAMDTVRAFCFGCVRRAVRRVCYAFGCAPPFCSHSPTHLHTQHKQSHQRPPHKKNRTRRSWRRSRPWPTARAAAPASWRSRGCTARAPTSCPSRARPR